MLSLILPTYNEAANLPELLPKLGETLSGIGHEIIIVDDDSPDGTWKMAQQLAENREDLHVIRRIGRRGLSSAVIEGFLAAKGDVLAVMDADGQHDLSVLPRMYDEVKSGVNIAVGSRYIEGGSVGDWDERRQVLSRMATRLAVRLCRVEVRDPMSGFFAIDRDTFEVTLPRLNPKGFKILLDFLVHVPKGTTAKELPISFGKRMHGESKLSRRVQLQFIEYLYDVTFGKFIPLTFIKYCIVGTLGIAVHMSAYYAISRIIMTGGGLTVAGFSASVIGATETAIIFNFLLNNVWTFAEQRLRGISAITGFLKFNAACILGAIANWAVSTYLYSLGWMEALAVFLGALTAVLWNYTVNRVMTWKD